jgi:hypothetical protein
MDDRNGNSLFGSLLPPLVLELAKSPPPQHRGEHKEQFIEKGFVRDGLQHTLLVSNRNGQLGEALPHLSFSIQWARISLLHVVCTLHSIGCGLKRRGQVFRLSP